MGRPRKAKPPQDSVLRHMQIASLRRWIALWKRSGTSLDLVMWSAQRLEVLAMDEFKSTFVRGVNAPEIEKAFSNYPAHRQRTWEPVEK